ncbi:hypothetical protein QCA50_009779 [Cerrena zonata]|uniref:DUF6533 domain-containing protein n=1 Tax=Cerrena zonata TaxID=2478898 RepID=A0AAW0G7A8_9APHY
MSELGLSPEEVVATLSSIQAQNFFLVAPFALIVYDTILTIPQEIKCIWKRKFSAVTVLYLFIRYGAVLDMLLKILSAFYTLTAIPVTLDLS